MTPSRGILLVLCGPSGVGKSTLSRLLAERTGVIYTVSVTTRPRKPGEDKGKTYQHITHDEFFTRLQNDEYLEYAQVYDHYYATPRHPTLDRLDEGKDVLLEIDVQGALQVRHAYRDALLVFILPPDEHALAERLQGRGRDDAAEQRKRFMAARREIAMAKGSHAFDHMIINDDLDRAAAELTKIVHHKRPLA